MTTSDHGSPFATVRSVVGFSVRRGSRRNCFRRSGPSSARWRSRREPGASSKSLMTARQFGNARPMAVFRTPRRSNPAVRDRLDPSRDLGHIDRDGADEDGE